MAGKAQNSVIEQEEFDSGEQMTLQGFGNWLAEASTQFKAAGNGVDYCTDSNLQDHVRKLFDSLKILKEVRGEEFDQDLADNRRTNFENTLYFDCPVIDLYRSTQRTILQL